MTDKAVDLYSFFSMFLGTELLMPSIWSESSTFDYILMKDMVSF